MDARIILLISLVLVQRCSPECLRCTYDNQEADCSVLALTKVPECLPPTITKLTLSNNNIDSLAADSLAYLPGLVELNLSANKLQALPDTVFSTLTNLTILYVATNNISTLSDTVFQKNGKLTILDLSYNSLTALKQVTLKPLTLLRELHLSLNLISSVETSSFVNNKNLVRMDLSWNKLTTLDKSAFSANSNVDIWLERNPWNCDCSTVSLMNSFKQQNITVKRDPYCETPADLAGTYWSVLKVTCN